MPTYAFTKGDLQIDHRAFGRHFVARIPIVTTDIIASDATLIANAKITAGDIIKMWNIPARTVIVGGVFETVVKGTTSGTLDIGLGGGTELFNAAPLDATVGTLLISTAGSSWGTAVIGTTFAATDTLDMNFIADETKGSWILWLEGFFLPASS